MGLLCILSQCNLLSTISMGMANSSDKVQYTVPLHAIILRVSKRQNGCSITTVDTSVQKEFFFKCQHIICIQMTKLLLAQVA
jgi:hypothetical protein